MDFASFEVITFDCYGTLIDWEMGIVSAVRSALPDLDVPNAEILAAYSLLEPKEQSGAYKAYRLILRSVLRRLGERFGRTAQNPDALSESLPHWKPFPDTVSALQRLKSRYKLGIISNIDDELFEGTAAQLGSLFDYVITAQQVRSYKPSPGNFEAALARIGCGKDRVLHVAESLYHDIAPARALGIANVWVNRSGGKAGASQHVEVQPSLTVSNLSALADLIGV